MDLTKLDTPDLSSPYAEQLRRGYSNLRFMNPLEKDFREFYVGQNLPRARRGLLHFRRASARR